MRVTYDPEADAIYLHVAEGEIAETTEVAPNVMLDLSASGELVGIEILDMAHRLGAKPLAMTFELLGPRSTAKAAE